MIYFKLLVTILVSISFSSCRTEIKHEKNDRWHVRLSDSRLFNEFAGKNKGKVTINNKIAEDYQLVDLNIDLLKIDNSLLNEISIKKSIINTLVITDSELVEIDLHHSTVGEMHIEDSELSNFICRGCVNKTTQIIDSKVFNSYIVLLQNNELTIKASTIRSSFSGSEIKKLIIEDTKFLQEKTSNIAHITSDYLYIKDSILNTDFYKSRIKRVVLENVKGRTAEFVRLEGERFSISDSSLARLNIYSITKSFRSFSSKNSSFSTMLVLGGKNMDTISITDCPAVSDLFIAEAVSDTVLIENCHFNAFKVHNSRIKSAQFKDLHISIPISFKAGLWRDFHMKRVLLENVHVDGTLEMKNARIDTLEARNFKTGKHFKLIDNGLNFHFAPDSVSSYSVADSPGTP